MEIIDARDIMFWNFNTEEVEKLLSEVEPEVTDGMTENEKKAYQLGVKNALSMMNQMLENVDKTEPHIQFYKKGELEEFTFDEVLELLFNAKSTWSENEESLPLTCGCGCKETEMRDVCMGKIDDTPVEVKYSLYCKDCGTYLGSYEYGHWEY